jgi:8-oxo-dGTP pyrophosphatase MutT (NUDIX family)
MAASRGVVKETSAGGVVFRRMPAGIRFLLIKDPYKKWGLPKGHVDSGESLAETAQREVAEETGLCELKLHAPLGAIDWHFRLRGKRIHKTCHFFLLEAPTGSPCPQTEEGILECQWFSHCDAMKTISYENARSILREAGSVVAGCFGDTELSN